MKTMKSLPAFVLRLLSHRARINDTNLRRFTFFSL